MQLVVGTSGGRLAETAKDAGQGGVVDHRVIAVFHALRPNALDKVLIAVGGVELDHLQALRRWVGQTGQQLAQFLGHIGFAGAGRAGEDDLLAVGDHGLQVGQGFGEEVGAIRKSSAV